MSSMFSCGWLWMYAGALLMLLELFAPGFIIFFFGLAAAITGLLRFVFGEALNASLQLISFSFFSIFFLVFVRRFFKPIFMGGKIESKTDFDNEYIGRIGKVVTEIDPPITGRVVIGDSEWTAESASFIASGENVKVISQNNLTMKVEVIK